MMMMIIIVIILKKPLLKPLTNNVAQRWIKQDR